MKTKDKIIKLFNENKELKIQEIELNLKISRQYIHRILAEMLEDNVIVKMGSAPKTIYRLVEIKSVKSERNIITKEVLTFLDLNFIVITEIGELLMGLDAFEYWCKKRKLPVTKTIEEYKKTFHKYEEYKNENGIVSGLHKLTSTKELVQIYLNDVWYLDFYAIERFGKTKLGNLIHYAKQGQSVALMKLLLKEIKIPLQNIIHEYQIDAVAFVPHTVKRKVQLMDYLEKRLELQLPKLKIDKLDGFVSVPQKSLQRIEERINNADYTFVTHSSKKYKNLLLIDDAVGSGATLNQIAKKFKDKKIAENIFGLAIVGSFKGFDVITEV
jgi:hypothetical protein